MLAGRHEVLQNPFILTIHQNSQFEISFPTTMTANTRELLKRPLNSIGLSAPPPTKKTKTETASPLDFVKTAFQKNGHSLKDVAMHAVSNFQRPTPELIKAYTMEPTKAVRDGDIKTVRRIHEDRKTDDNGDSSSVNCCNRFGDSLLHIACRRGHTEVAKFLVHEAGACVSFLDDLKRTPLHDALWTAEPNFELVDFLLQESPELALCPDNRGATPFDYARRCHWEDVWMPFLQDRIHLFRIPMQ